MDSAIAQDTSRMSEPRSKASTVGAQLPLAMVSQGSCVTIARVRGDQDFRLHMAELGFVENAEVEVMSRAGGSVLVKVKGASFAINQSTAMKIATC